MPVHREGELEFDFGTAQVTRLDEQGVPLPSGMRFVDFVVREPERAWLIEVKDPGEKGVPAAERQRFAQGFRPTVDENLVPKARDSYCYLHLMNETVEPLIYVVVLGIEDPAFLGPMQERLRQRLAQETERPWQRKYVTDGVILTVDNFGTHMPFRVRRLR